MFHKKNRRDFIIFLMYGIISLPLLSFLKIDSNRKSKSCTTDADVEGPFHRNNAPYRNDLSKGYSGSGTKLKVHGTIMDNECKPITNNAVLDIWHAGPDGKYDEESKQYIFRGKIKSDKKGYYYFTTMLPAPYEDNGLLRPKHIHFKVSAPNFKKLTTQLYFEDDPFLKNDRFVIKNNGLKRAMPIKEGNSILKVQFNINLENDTS